jgi:hypothetical protein
MSNQENIILVISEITVPNPSVLSNPTVVPPRKVFQKMVIRNPISMASIIYNK